MASTERSSTTWTAGKASIATLLACLLLAETDPAPAQPRPVAPPAGPPPEWNRFRELGEAAIRAGLVDPDSARFEWPYGLSPGGFQPPLRRRIPGYATCGTVNARNRMGGYSGSSTFVVVVDQDRVIYSEIGRPRATDLLAAACAQAVREGHLAPALNTPVTSPDASTLTAIGLETATASNGLVVIAVTPDSAAARAGIRQGMLLTHVNGAALGGLDDEVLGRILSAAQGAWAFTVNGGTIISVTRPLTTSGAERQR